MAARESGGMRFIAKSLYVSAALSGCACLAFGLRHLHRISKARRRLRALLEPVAGQDARVVITGANSGIARELSWQLLQHPSVALLLGCRDKQSTENLFARHKGRAIVHQLDLLNPDSVQAFCEEAHAFLKGGGAGLRMLVSNAGAMRPPPAAQGFDATWRTHFLGPFLLTELLGRLRCLPGETGAQPVRVVQVSSSLERQSELDASKLEAVAQGEANQDTAYADSKRALLLWISVRCQNLAFKGGLYCHAATPGMVDTELGWHSTSPWLWPFTKFLGMMPPAEGALNIATAGLRVQATECFGRYMDGQEELENLAMERMGEKRFAVEVVKWATTATALDQRAAGYER
eukprot:TRINITY_DN34828_c0_g1_i1.p1 TRINITY_DN34828_c0_g1~~TRINITY_DN34828_c0_g1_i1.p1  ORF type:complete len:348 (-),score=53.22 TRINITY_DN34828_c0_g1_i1:391-1434(-)